MVTKNLPNKALTGVTAMGFAVALSLGAATAYGQTSKTVKASQNEMKTAENGWSAKKNIMGKAVYNDNNEKIGNVDDVIFSRNKSAASFAVIGVGGFLGMGTHDVLVPLNHLKHENDKLVLPGATKDALKAMPNFDYAKSQKSDKTDNRTSSR